MFTGIIEELGIIKAVKHTPKGAELLIAATNIFNDLKPGHSVAVNGVCLTAKYITNNTFACDVMPETLNRTTLGSTKIGGSVNLERAMQLSDRFGGHIVSGHIDGTGTIKSLNQNGISIQYTISADPGIMRYIIEKGSVALDGASLTISARNSGNFEVSIIPHTLKNTILSTKKPGDKINIECDPVGKYIDHLISTPYSAATPNEENNSGITLDFLAKHGY